MKDINNFLSKLHEETEKLYEAEDAKNLAREEALSLVAEFVKNVKKKFEDPSDVREVLNTVLKTLQFYVDQIAAGDFPSSLGVRRDTPDHRGLGDVDIELHKDTDFIP